MKNFILFALGVVLSTTLAAQDFNFDLSLKPVSNIDAPGLHSYAVGTHEGKWLIIGGRLDGLHARQPFNAFPGVYNNTDIYVIDPVSKEVWSSSVSVLDTSIAEQLQATNMCFHQEGDTLYIVGGYAFSSSQNDHITFPYLTSIQVSPLINAIVQGESMAPHIKQVSDQRMAVTGAHLAFQDDHLMIVGGHRFDGRYNPMGHNTYTQTYTNSIRSFQVDNTGNSPVIQNFTETTDAAHLHRRDYNLVPQIFGDGSFGHMISSGVFQVNVDLPFLYPVEIRDNGHQAVTSFNQYLSNYHSAHVTLHDTNSQATHSLFFGGMAQYYYQDSTLIEDQNVPFVKTISRVTRSSNDDLQEFVLPVEMPDLQGASAEFIRNTQLATLHHEILILTDADSMLIGYVYGGIESGSLNPFTDNNTGSTSASPVIYEVWLINTDETSTQVPIIGSHNFTTEVYPNPGSGDIRLRLHAPLNGISFVTITDQMGKAVEHFEINDLKKGRNDFLFLPAGTLSPGVYNLSFSFNDRYYSTSSLVIQ